MISGMQELSYPEKLLKLNLSTLVYRRNRRDEIMKANTLPALFSTVSLNSIARGHHLKLVKQSTIPRACTQFFPLWIVHSWNKLFNETVTAEFVFKQRMNAGWSSRECKLNWDATAPGHKRALNKCVYLTDAYLGYWMIDKTRLYFYFQISLSFLLFLLLKMQFLFYE